MYLTDQTILSEGVHKPQYGFADRNSALSKNLYNAALFRLRQVFTGWDKTARTENEEEVFREIGLLKAGYPSIKVGRVLSYKALEKLMRVTGNPDFFSGLPMQTAQAVVKRAVQDMKDWLAALKAYRKDPSPFTGKPRMPRYSRNAHKTFTVSNQDAVLYPVYRDGGFSGMELKLPGIRERILLGHLPESARLREVTFKPYFGKYVMILTLEVQAPPFYPDMPGLAAIDFGTDNIAALVTTDGSSYVYKGGAVMAENRLFHKEKAKAVSIITKGTRRKSAGSAHLARLSGWHDCFMTDYMHKVSSDIIKRCVEHRVGTLVIGTNTGWKQGVCLGTVNNQNFVSIPHAVLRWMIGYKAGIAGMTVIEQEESYTSKADITAMDEIPVYGKENGRPVFSGRRVSRGMYLCRDGSLINADCNGAANILRKAIPDAWAGRTDFRFLAVPKSVGYWNISPRYRAQAAL